jgi:hypothetical protein
VTAIQTAGYYSPGDEGGAVYVRTAVAGPAAGKVQSADGQWWVLNVPLVNVKMFGAKGDNATDDTAAFQAALNFGQAVFVPDGNYILASSLTVASFQRIFANYSLLNTNLADNNGGVKLVFTGTATACFNTASQIKYFSMAGITIVATGTYNWIFNFITPIQCTFENVWASNQNVGGGVYQGTYATGVTSWINTFFNCFFGVPTAGTQYNNIVGSSDSFFISCYFSGGLGFKDISFGGNVYTGCHFDNINNSQASAAGLTFVNNTDNTGVNCNSAVTGCYFDNNYQAIRFDATNAPNNCIFGTSVTGCIFRGASGGQGDLYWVGAASNQTTGTQVTGCCMSGGAVTSFAFSNTNFKQASLVNNSNIFGAINFANVNGLSIFDNRGFIGNQGNCQALKTNGLLNAAGGLQIPVTTSTTLPAGPQNGQVVFITDGSVTTPGAIAAGGGSTRILINYDGTNWRVA